MHLKVHIKIYACFNCSKAYKQKSKYELTDVENSNRKYLCPNCGEPMNDMGHDFRAPQKDDSRQWKKVEILFRQGITYHSCGCGAGYRPEKLSQVDEFLENRYEKNQGIKLLKKINRATNANNKRKYKFTKTIWF